MIDGRHRLITDEPERLGGDGSAPAPHELVSAAVAACVATSLVMYARAKGWDLGEVSVDIEFDNRSTPRGFDVGIQLTGDISAEQMERLEKVARACPVRRSFEVGAVFRESIVCAALAHAIHKDAA